VPSPEDPSVLRNYAHIYCMGSVTRDLIDRFIEELASPDAFPDVQSRGAGAEKPVKAEIHLREEETVAGRRGSMRESAGVDRVCV
jgi:hypothetical protein